MVFVQQAQHKRKSAFDWSLLLLLAHEENTGAAVESTWPLKLVLFFYFKL